MSKIERLYHFVPFALDISYLYSVPRVLCYLRVAYLKTNFRVELSLIFFSFVYRDGTILFGTETHDKGPFTFPSLRGRT